MPRLDRTVRKTRRPARWLFAMAAVAGALALVSAGLAYLTAQSDPGGAGASFAGSVNQVTGLSLGTGAVTPSANPNLALTWDSATLSPSGAVDGYQVNRYDNSNVEQTTGAACAGLVTGTVCTESSVPDGTWKYGVQARFATNWVGPESTRLTIKIDTSAPSITAKPSDPSANTNPSFSFTHPTFASFKCRIDSDAFAACTSPVSAATLHGSNLTNGTHTFRVEALDASGFATQVATYSWTLNTVGPTISGPATPTAATGASFTFSDGTYTSFKCSLDQPGGSGLTACTSPKSYSGLADGSHTFKAEGVGADGSTTALVSYGWTVNTAAPTINTKPAATSATANPTFTFSHAVYTSFQCKLDAGSFAACNSGSQSYSSLADGLHTFTVEALDSQSNATATATYTWTINTTTPAITAKPSDPSANKTPVFSFTDSPYTTFQCKIDTGTFASCTSGSAIASQADGSHTFSVRAVDASGATTSAAAYTWTVNTAAPTITTKPAAKSANASPTFTFSHGVYTSFSCKLDAGAFAACNSGTVSYSSLSNASHTFTVEALDAQSVATTVSTYTWTVDASAPTIATKPANPSASAAPAFTFSQSNYASFECQLDGGGYSACTSGVSYAPADGSHTFNVRAIDADGIRTAAAGYTWTQRSAAPSITSGPSTPSANKTPSFAFSETGYTSFQCKVDAAAFASCTSPNTIASQADGSHTFSVRAVDANGVTTSAATYTWTVNTTAPTIASVGGMTAGGTYASQSQSFTFGHSIYTAFQCLLDGGSFATCTSPTTFSGLTDGSHTVTAAATDGDGVKTSSATFQWNVKHAAPTITSQPANPTNATSATFNFSESPYTAFMCQLDGGAPTACNSGTASYSGLTGGAATSHTFKVHAVDSIGGSTADQTYTWTIDTVAPGAPTSLAYSDGNNGQGDKITGTAEANSTVTATETAGPHIGTVYTATASGTGTFTITVDNVKNVTVNYSVTAKDAAGNTGSATSLGATSDTN